MQETWGRVGWQRRPRSCCCSSSLFFEYPEPSYIEAYPLHPEHPRACFSNNSNLQCLSTYWYINETFLHVPFFMAGYPSHLTTNSPYTVPSYMKLPSCSQNPSDSMCPFSTGSSRGGSTGIIRSSSVGSLGTSSTITADPIPATMQEMDAERSVRRARRNRTCFTRIQVCWNELFV